MWRADEVFTSYHKICERISCRKHCESMMKSCNFGIVASGIGQTSLGGEDETRVKNPSNCVNISSLWEKMLQAAVRQSGHGLALCIKWQVFFFQFRIGYGYDSSLWKRVTKQYVKGWKKKESEAMQVRFSMLSYVCVEEPDENEVDCRTEENERFYRLKLWVHEFRIGSTTSDRGGGETSVYTKSWVSTLHGRKDQIISHRLLEIVTSFYWARYNFNVRTSWKEVWRNCHSNKKSLSLSSVP